MSINEQSAAAPVIIAGAGLTGLTLATELRRGGADVVLLERRPNREVEGSRAAGMQPRTIEMLDQRGIADRFLAEGPPSELGNFAGIKLDYSTLPSRFPYALNIMQAETERVLEDVAAELGAAVRWSAEVTGVRQGGGGVEVCVEGPGGAQTESGSHLVGCDGGRSTVRKLIGAEFPGTDATMVALIGDVELDEPPQRPLFLERRERGLITVIQFRPGWYRVVTVERERSASLTIQSPSRSYGPLPGESPAQTSECTAPVGFHISTTRYVRLIAIGWGECCWPAMQPTFTCQRVGKA